MYCSRIRIYLEERCLPLQVFSLHESQCTNSLLVVKIEFGREEN